MRGIDGVVIWMKDKFADAISPAKTHTSPTWPRITT
jgi:hypothetical protein